MAAVTKTDSAAAKNRTTRTIVRGKRPPPEKRFACDERAIGSVTDGAGFD